jgi:hypothetical protein
MSILGTVSAAQRIDDAYDLSSFLEPGFDERLIDFVRNERICRDEHVGTRYENREQRLGEPAKEGSQPIAVNLLQDGEARKRAALTSVEGGRDAPHAALAAFSLLQLSRSVFDEPIGRVRNYRVYRSWSSTGEPLEGIGVEDFVATKASLDLGVEERGPIR